MGGHGFSVWKAIQFRCLIILQKSQFFIESDGNHVWCEKATVRLGVSLVMKRPGEHPPGHLLGLWGTCSGCLARQLLQRFRELSSCTPALFLSTRDSFPPGWLCVIRKQTQLRPRGQVARGKSAPGRVGTQISSSQFIWQDVDTEPPGAAWFLQRL